MLRRQSSTEIDQVAKIRYRSSFDEYDYVPQFQTLDEMEALKAFRNVIFPSNQLWVETNKK